MVQGLHSVPSVGYLTHVYLLNYPIPVSLSGSYTNEMRQRKVQDCLTTHSPSLAWSPCGGFILGLSGSSWEKPHGWIERPLLRIPSPQSTRLEGRMWLLAYHVPSCTTSFIFFCILGRLRWPGLVLFSSKS